MCKKKTAAGPRIKSPVCRHEVEPLMRFRMVLLTLLLLVFLSCAGSRDYVNPTGDPYGAGRSWWGTDAICAPGCPVGMSGSW
ncbi:MAG: hypothetical protein JRI59_01200 [Deltaproteobacteria bacterium]|nr:hypothetical protein [Deltaproteobacteria bacterium]